MNEIQPTYFRFFDIFSFVFASHRIFNSLFVLFEFEDRFLSENVSIIRNAQVAVILLVNDIFHISIEYNKRIKQAVV